jgi:hypothetical protein
MKYAIIEQCHQKVEAHISFTTELINPEQGRYITVPWCRFFIPKMASAGVKPGDTDLNEHIMYAKCIKGHVLKNADDWILCENLPAPDAKCWQEGGDTIFSLRMHKRNEFKEIPAGDNNKQDLQKTATSQKSKS